MKREESPEGRESEGQRVLGARGLKGGQDARGAQRVPRARMHLYRIVCIVRARWRRRVALPVPALMVDFPSDFLSRVWRWQPGRGPVSFARGESSDQRMNDRCIDRGGGESNRVDGP